MNTEAKPAISRPRKVRRILFRLCLGLVALLLVAWLFENIRGRLAWNKYRREWEAKGERFDIASVIPKPVPPEQNFATTPFFAPFLDYGPAYKDRWKDKAAYESNRTFVVFSNRSAPKAKLEAGSNRPSSKAQNVPKAGSWEAGRFTDLRDWQDYFEGNTNFPFAVTPGDAAQDVLTALRKFDALLAELGAAAARPHCAFPIHYEEHFNALLPHLASLKAVAQITQLRALARLEAGQSAAALDDVLLGLRLAEALKSEPLLISQLVRMAMIQVTLQPVWEGLARRRWSTEQIAALQEALLRVQVLEEYARAMRGERAFTVHVIDLVRTGQITYEQLGESEDGPAAKPLSFARLLPGGYYRQNQLRLARMFQERCLPLVEVEKHRVHAARTEQAEDVPELKGFKPYSVFAALLFPAVAKSAHRFARTQGALDLASVACALERHRLAAGRYPDALAELTPKLLAKLPPDITTGEPLPYRHADDGQFLLYSVGWNETDDGGLASTNRSGIVDGKQGDWVWRHPAAPQGK